MKKQNKLCAIVAMITLGTFFAMADGVVTVDNLATPLDLTVFTNTVTLTASTDYRAIEKIVVKNNSTSTATIVATIQDGAVFTPLATWTLLTTASTNNYPLRAGSYGTTSNAVPYLATKLRLITTLSATNAVTANLDVYVYGEKE